MKYVTQAQYTFRISQQNNICFAECWTSRENLMDFEEIVDGGLYQKVCAILMPTLSFVIDFDFQHKAHSTDLIIDC